ncbi:MAG TPA: dihydroneopterin aldolase [Verrucomicrobiae bacterium]|jgi:dihydroneopterin aldolase|nr:dihydroneopterin aldolase [Verrucomicrobiae bacterium]
MLPGAMSRIKITDLEVFYCVGVSEQERAQPQRLLLTIDMIFDFTAAAMSDRLTKTIDYFAVAQMLLKYGEGRNWKLIEKLAMNVADEILGEYRPDAVTVEVKKFPIAQAGHVSVVWSRKRS